MLAASGTALLAVVGSVPPAIARTVASPSPSYATASEPAASWDASAPLARSLSLSLVAQPAVVAQPAPVVRASPPRISAARPDTLRAVGPTYVGRASWYGPGFQGRRTANGERFDTQDLTAAHKFLPFGTRLRVCRVGRCVVVRVNDRGPYVRGRFLDLSKRAAQMIGVTEQGVCTVTATVLAPAPAGKGSSWADATR